MPSLHRRHQSTNQGFTLMELMTTMVVAGILSGIAISSMSQPWRRQRLDSAAKELTAWLEQRRIQAIQTSRNCIISIDASQAQLAAASDNSCGEFGLLDLRSTSSNSQSLSLSSANNASELLFTPRGTSTTTAELSLSLPAESRQRCINITSPLGLIRLGRRLSASDACDYTTAQ